MLWYCKFKWHPQTTAEALRRRILEQDEAGTNHPKGSEAGKRRSPPFRRRTTASHT